MTPAELASTAGVEPQQLEALEAGRPISTVADDADAASAAFGHRMCELRAERGMSQEDLADKTDMHPTAIGRIERGKREPRLTTILRVARGLDVQPGALLNELDWPDREAG
jgi:DNA-binding XRE family transcriptional regulator